MSGTGKLVVLGIFTLGALYVYFSESIFSIYKPGLGGTDSVFSAVAASITRLVIIVEELNGTSHTPTKWQSPHLTDI
jgi:hypothetical protein